MHPRQSSDHGDLRRLLTDRRKEILRVAVDYGATDVRLFGSVARGDDTERSDVDLLVELPVRRMLLNVSGLSARLTDLLGVRVDVTTPRLLSADVAPAVARDVPPDLVADAVLRRLAIIGEAAAQLDSVGRARAPEAPWGDIIGLRNRVVHD